MNQTNQNIREYTPQVYIDKGYVEFLKDDWIKTEFIYKGENIVSIHLYRLLCNPLRDKPYFKLIDLCDKTYLETYFPFLEIKHVIPLTNFCSFENQQHETTLTKYIKCNRYEKHKPYIESDIICTINNDIKEGLHYKLINTKKFNKTATWYEQELEADNHYKFNYSYYKSEYYETLKEYNSSLFINKNQFVINISNCLDENDKTEFIIYNPIQYKMDLEFELYKQLTN